MSFFRKLSLTTAAMLAVFAGSASAAVIESFDTLDFAVNAAASNDIGTNGASASVSLDPSVKTEGSNSLKLTYNYSGNQYFEVCIEKTYATPVDLSPYNSFHLKLRGDAVSSSFVWYANFVGENGKYYRYVGWNPVIPDGTFLDANWGRSEMEFNPWQPARDAVEISKITKIQIFVQKRAGSITAGTTNINFDAFEGFSAADGRVVADTIASFDSYADTAALQAAWPTSAGGTGNAISAALVPDKDASGKAMRLDSTIALKWYTLAATNVLPATLDLTQYKYFTFWMKGDATLAGLPSGAAPIVFLRFEDSAVNRVRAWSTSTIKKGEWICVFIAMDANLAGFTPVNVDNADQGTDGRSKMLADERWDGGGDCVLNDIRKVQFCFTENGLDTNYTSQITIGKLMGYKYVAAPAAVGDWSIY